MGVCPSSNSRKYTQIILLCWTLFMFTLADHSSTHKMKCIVIFVHFQEWSKISVTLQFLGKFRKIITWNILMVGQAQHLKIPTPCRYTINTFYSSFFKIKIGNTDKLKGVHFIYNFLVIHFIYTSSHLIYYIIIFGKLHRHIW